MVKRSPRDGRSTDPSFGWLTRVNGPEWEGWRLCMEGWLKTQDKSRSVKINAMNWFAGEYLPKLPQPALISSFFQAGADGFLPDLRESLRESMSETTASKNANWIADFVDWSLDEFFNDIDDNNHHTRFYKNPFSKQKQSFLAPVETVYNAMPHAYIRELRSILCPVKRGNFCDWKFAQSLSGQPTSDGRGSSAFSDWIEVSEYGVERDDPDSVYRTRRILRDGQYINIVELWSPVRAVGLYLKLELPLRTHQVRMLDSGEADTLRYVNGEWHNNERHLRRGRETNPYARGVFRRMSDHVSGVFMTGLFISTNKTSDINKDGRDRGYEIPWQHEDVLYWLEKLRNWQEKHNPIEAPTACTDLDDKHLGGAKSENQKQQMGFMCFLFRDPTAKSKTDRSKPIIKTAFNGHWYKLLAELEARIANRGQTLDDGSPIVFVEPPKKGVLATKTFFPLHSLRVSLISSYIMEGGVPIPAMGKLLAGHSRLLMVLHYTKVSISKMTALMNEASANVEKREHDSLQVFLRDATLQQITEETAFQSESTVRASLAMRNPVGWDYRHLGMCLVGGNNVYLDEASMANGCWNGGQEVIGSKPIRHERVHHGDGNCACCRFLITDASYLPQWVAHLNIISYRASMAAETAIAAEQERDELMDERYYAVSNNLPFTRHKELQRAERRCTQQQTEVNDYALDLQYCFKTIARLLMIEEAREESDKGQKLLATGTISDIKKPISLLETKSELWQLSVILDDAELYPDEVSGILTTPAIHKRNNYLNRFLMRNDYVPIFMNMSDRMQLIAGNAMMRAMSRASSANNRVEGFRQVTGLIEAGEAVPQLDLGIEALQQIIGQPPLRLKDLIAKQANGIGVRND